jgi:hypothetical protein
MRGGGGVALNITIGATELAGGATNWMGTLALCVVGCGVANEIAGTDCLVAGAIGAGWYGAVENEPKDWALAPKAKKAGHTHSTGSTINAARATEL